MIKVNLLGELRAAAGGTDSSSGFSNPDQEAAKKLLMVFLFPLLIYAWEFYNIGNLEEESRKVGNRANQLSGEVKARESASKKSLVLQKEINEIEDRIEAIKTLSKVRLREVKALDTLQNMMPEKVWFENIKYGNQRMEVLGYAVNDEDLTLFLKSMNEQSYFSDVVLKTAKEIETEFGLVKQFQISCLVVDGA